MVVLYSDGLIEDRDTGVEPGMHRLREAAAILAPEGPEALATHLLPELDRESADDIAILVLGAPG
jgi:serine phosphatase RsbU (regulator of sigma subunit)